MALGCSRDLGVKRDDLLALSVDTLLSLSLMAAHTLFSRILLLVELLALGHSLLKLFINLLDGEIGLRGNKTALNSDRWGHNLRHAERDFKFDGRLFIHERWRYSQVLFNVIILFT